MRTTERETSNCKEIQSVRNRHFHFHPQTLRQIGEASRKLSGNIAEYTTKLYIKKIAQTKTLFNGLYRQIEPTTLTICLQTQISSFTHNSIAIKLKKKNHHVRSLPSWSWLTSSDYSASFLLTAWVERRVITQKKQECNVERPFVFPARATRSQKSLSLSSL